jgi:hypothetical protein
MANKPQVVDAIKTEKVSSSSGQSAVKVDASGIAQALQQMVQQATNKAAAQQPQASRINPSVYMRDIVTEMEKLYERFDKLKKLAAEFHGLQTDTPVPEHVKIESVTLKFSVTKDGKAEACTADIYNVPFVGDLSNLLTTEFGVIISSLKNYAAQMVDISTKTTDRCSTALQDWEKQNNRRVLSAEEAAVMTAAADQPAAAPAAPPAEVTLDNT